MSKIYYPDTFKIEVVMHYKMHRNIGATLEKYGSAERQMPQSSLHFAQPYSAINLIENGKAS